MPNNPPKAKSKSKPRKRIKKDSYDRHDMIYSSGWNRLRDDYKSRYPICQRCEYLNNVTVSSTRNLSVHHIRMRNHYPDLAWCESNLLTLCQKCHGRFSIMENNNQEEQAIKEGEEIKANYTAIGHRVAIIGNINSGKSAVTDYLKNHYDISFFAIDDYRRKYMVDDKHKEDQARYDYIHDIRNSKHCIITCTGYGYIWEQIKPLITHTILVYADVDICKHRYTNRGAANYVPLPNEWKINALSSIDKINSFHRTINADLIINTSQCTASPDFMSVISQQIPAIDTLVSK